MNESLPNLSVSTNWISRSVETGAEIVAAAAEVGIRSLELAYSLSHGQAAQLRDLRRQGAFTVSSVHAWCPAPMGFMTRGPEPYSLCDPHPRARERAVAALRDTADFAASVDAGVVVVHAGRVAQAARPQRRLADTARKGLFGEPKYERRLQKLLDVRDRKAAPYLDALRESLDELLPVFEERGLRLALENLPTMDAVPNEPEMSALLAEYDTPTLRYWHDLGHGQIREKFGFIHHEGLVKRVAKSIGGVHVHGAPGVDDEHLMPPLGAVRYPKFAFLAELGVPLVLEPAPGTPPEQVKGAAAYLREIWAGAPTESTT